MNAFEEERLKNIERNKALLKELELNTIKAEAAPQTSSRPPAKKRKLDFPPPTRSSARISAVVKPSYVEVDETRLPRKGASSRKHSIIKDKLGKQPKPELPAAEKDDIVEGWNWEPTALEPTRNDEGRLHFDDYPDFTPNKTPEEVLREGSFGGSYFRPLYSRKLGFTVEDDYLELPASWTTNLQIDRYLTSPTYDPSVNKFGVACGLSIEEWEASGWIDHAHDVRGWFQWYTRFYLGRRCDDDKRQVIRWKKCVGDTGRWRRTLLKKYVDKGVTEVFDDGEEVKEVSPIIHQTCHHWAFEVRQEVLDEYWRTRK